MNEVEVKILEIDRKEIEEKLIKLGAVKIFDDEMYDIKLDNKEGALKNNKQLLRIRKEGKEITLTFKDKSRSEFVKSSEEIEVTVSDFDTIKELFSRLGFTEERSIHKHRTSYKLNNIRYEFDKYLGEYDFVPGFLEIEAQSESDVLAAAKLLGFAKEACKPWTTIDIIEHYPQIKK
ncbi:MAG: class IV adenylate cyclase [Candidatus Woesearchaeota archaeon]